MRKGWGRKGLGYKWGNFSALIIQPSLPCSDAALSVSPAEPRRGPRPQDLLFQHTVVWREQSWQARSAEHNTGGTVYFVSFEYFIFCIISLMIYFMWNTQASVDACMLFQCAARFKHISHTWKCIIWEITQLLNIISFMEAKYLPCFFTDWFAIVSLFQVIRIT